MPPQASGPSTELKRQSAVKRFRVPHPDRDITFVRRRVRPGAIRRTRMKHESQNKGEANDAGGDEEVRVGQALEATFGAGFSFVGLDARRAPAADIGSTRARKRVVARKGCQGFVREIFRGTGS